MGKPRIKEKVPNLSEPAGWIEGLEPSVSRTTIWRVNQLRYIHHIMPAFPANVPKGIRTPDPRLRRPLLYPAELWTHSKTCRGLKPATRVLSQNLTQMSRIIYRILYNPLSPFTRRASHFLALSSPWFAAFEKCPAALVKSGPPSKGRVQ